MKRILPLFLLLFLLSGCANIAVKDFGPYWNKGAVDYTLLGWWETPPDDDQFRIRVMNRSATLHIDLLDKKGWEHPEEAQRARTLQIGRYSFMLIKRQDRIDHWIPFAMSRYKVDGKKLRTYSLNAKRMRKFLEKNYPDEKNIVAGCKEKCFSEDTISITKLDSNVYAILSNIPDTKEFWTLDKGTLQKIR